MTFTRDAAGELRRRLRRLDIHEPIEAGTFHSIALRLLRDRALTRNESMPSLAPDRSRLVRECLKELRLELDPYPAMADIDWARARRIAPADYERQSRAAHGAASCRRRGSSSWPAAYERLKRRRGVVDFDDLLELNLRAMETDEAFRSLVHWRFRHFFVDEAQDLNPLQHALLEAWRGGRADICLVGDPRQAIYGWNGADHTTMTEVERVYPGVTVIALDDQLPLLAAGGQCGRGRAGRQRSSRRHGQQSAGRAATSNRVVPDDEARGRGHRVARACRIATSTAPSGIAVLARTNDQLVPIERSLGAAEHRDATRRRTVAAGDRARRRLSHDQLARRWRCGPTSSSPTHDPIRRRVAEEVDRFLSSQEPGGVSQLGRRADAVRRSRHRRPTTAPLSC